MDNVQHKKKFFEEFKALLDKYKVELYVHVDGDTHGVDGVELDISTSWKSDHKWEHVFSVWNGNGIDAKSLEGIK